MRSGSDDERMGRLLEDLKARIRSITPQFSFLLDVTRKLPGAEGGMDRRELHAVARGLERVWQIMRLLKLLSEYFGDRLFFGGDSILNYVYMINYAEPPRLTFDLDSAWHRRVTSKRVLIGEMLKFNMWLSEEGLTLDLPITPERTMKIFVIEYDREKDHFPTLLSLRMPVITRYDGRPFYEFLGMRNHNLITRLRGVFEEMMGVRNPRIDYIRLEVSLDPGEMPREEVMLKDAFGFEAKAWITELGYQLASKITHKVARDFGPDLRYNLHDVLKAALDLRLLGHVDGESVRMYVGSMDLHVTRHNLASLLSPGARKIWKDNYHYTLVRKRYSLEELVGHVNALMEEIGR
ncbi:MAG: hypothetical protein BA066_05845 [Candidatus Korarchaeota archaeon NZ13-K]|nr:MAG: hypothetical protein BA066_05845 [Candidatus Korarchaeota archaeon NZ13-K]